MFIFKKLGRQKRNMKNYSEFQFNTLVGQPFVLFFQMCMIYTMKAIGFSLNCFLELY